MPTKHAYPPPHFFIHFTLQYAAFFQTACPPMISPTDFSRRLIAWQRQHGRHHLPWQVREPYRVWLSEIMLQQTQVATVLDYYPRFIARFPDVAALAAAPQDDVLNLWAGLGYYSRARNLHKAAKQVVHDFGGVFPPQRQALETLCGVGRSTAAAIAAFAFHEREAILDGNVKRVLCRVFAQEGNLADKKFEQALWALAESLLPPENKNMPAYTQGLMDLGATVCKRSKPLCAQCPMADGCLAKAQNRIADLPRKKEAIRSENPAALLAAAAQPKRRAAAGKAAAKRHLGRPLLRALLRIAQRSAPLCRTTRHRFRRPRRGGGAHPPPHSPPATDYAVCRPHRQAV
jgi:A/G-specific adenine glycosylase